MSPQHKEDKFYHLLDIKDGKFYKDEGKKKLIRLLHGLRADFLPEQVDSATNSNSSTSSGSNSGSSKEVVRNYDRRHRKSLRSIKAGNSR